MWVAFHIFFSKNISVYTIFNDKGFNDTLTNDIVSFEQLGPDSFLISPKKYIYFEVIIIIANLLNKTFL